MPTTFAALRYNTTASFKLAVSGAAREHQEPNPGHLRRRLCRGEGFVVLLELFKSSGAGRLVSLHSPILMQCDPEPGRIGRFPFPGSLTFVGNFACVSRGLMDEMLH